MKVCIVGGIFDKGADYRSKHRMTPETILATGLESRGVSVTTAGHRQPPQASQFDIIHVHHLGPGALRTTMDPSSAAFVYTHHQAFVGLPSLMTKLVGIDCLRPSISGLRAGAAARLVMRCADTAIALSWREAEVHRKLYHLREENQAVIANGIPSGLFTTANRAPADPPEFLYVGQLVPLKRVEVLITALAVLPEPVVLRLVHQVDDLRVQLGLQARHLGIEHRVLFEGPKTPEEIAVLLDRATALVLPSAMEALPSVISEALLAGVPVVATNVGGVGDQVGAYGRLVEPGSPTALAEAMYEVIQQRAGWLERTDAIRRWALSRFSVDQMIDDHIAAYERALSRHQRRRNNWQVAPWRHLASVVSQAGRNQE